MDFDFLRGLAPGRLDGFSIERYEKNRGSFDLYAAKFESGTMRFAGKNLLISLKRGARALILRLKRVFTLIKIILYHNHDTVTTSLPSL